MVELREALKGTGLVSYLTVSQMNSNYYSKKVRYREPVGESITIIP